MTNNFRYDIDGNAENIKSRLTEILASEIKKPYVKTSWNKLELVIKIEKMGTSEIKIQLKDQDDKCSIQESKRSVAMMHKPFITEVEKMVDHVLIQKLGATKTA